MKFVTERICFAALLLVCSVAASPPLWPQTDAVASKVKVTDASAYEVVSIKPYKSDQGVSSMYSLPDGFRWTNFPVVSLVRAAYGISMDNQIEGLPGWANSDPYDFEVKADEKTTETWKSLSYKERYKKEEPMMQSLLADRCQFKGHVVMREMAVYDLVIAKGGLKMKEAAPGEGSSESMGGNKLEARAQSTDAIIGAFQGVAGRMIVDKTGLAGRKFDFEMTWAEDRRDGTADAGPSIFTVLEEELGVKLVPGKGPVPVLIIDHIEKPSPN